MILVLGYPLASGRKKLEEQGYTVRCVETRSRKGVQGDDMRVIRQKLLDADSKTVEIVYAIFHTNQEVTAR